MSHICAEVVWKIENFSLLPETERVLLRTPPFEVRSLKRTNWYFSVCFDKPLSESVDKWLFCLDSEEDYFEETNIKVGYICSMDMGLGTYMLVCFSSNNRTSKRISSSTYPTRRILTEDKSLLPHDTLTLRFQILNPGSNWTTKSAYVFETVLPDTENSCIWGRESFYSTSIETYDDYSTNVGCKCSAKKRKRSEEGYDDAFQEKLRCLHFDMQNIYRSGRLSDFTLKVQDKTFPVHSFILSARSSVFDRMLETNMTEKKDRVLVLDDFDVDTVKWMLDYLYTDNVGQMDWNKALKLYYSADKYDIRDLKERASWYLVKNMNPKNVLEILELADRHNDADVKAASVKFIFHHEPEVMSSDEMKMLAKNNPELVAEISEEISKLKNI